jgi:hypothetical protein
MPKRTRYAIKDSDATPLVTDQLEHFTKFWCNKIQNGRGSAPLMERTVLGHIKNVKLFLGWCEQSVNGKELSLHLYGDPTRFSKYLEWLEKERSVTKSAKKLLDTAKKVCVFFIGVLGDESETDSYQVVLRDYHSITSGLCVEISEVQDEEDMRRDRKYLMLEELQRVRLGLQARCKWIASMLRKGKLSHPDAAKLQKFEFKAWRDYTMVTIATCMPFLRARELRLACFSMPDKKDSSQDDDKKCHFWVEDSPTGGKKCWRCVCQKCSAKLTQDLCAISRLQSKRKNYRSRGVFLLRLQKGSLKIVNALLNDYVIVW